MCADEAARKPFGGRQKSGNFSRLNKSSLWGTVFPGAIRMRTQTSLHYVTTALEIPALGEKPPRPPAEAPLACSDAFLSALSPSLFIPLILFSTPLLAFNPTLPLSFLFDAIRPLKLLRLPPPVRRSFPPVRRALPHIFPIILHEGPCRTWKPLIHHFGLWV